jgi:uncharacterized protein (TIGR00369 family)
VDRRQISGEVDLTTAPPDPSGCRGGVVRDDLCTRSAVLNGGAVMAFADTLGTAGTVLNLPEGAWTTTIESKTNFHGPAPLGPRVMGEATPVHRGRTTMVWQTRVTRGGAPRRLGDPDATHPNATGKLNWPPPLARGQRPATPTRMGCVAEPWLNTSDDPGTASRYAGGGSHNRGG